MAAVSFRYIFGIPPLILVLLPVTSSDCHIQDKEGKAYESVLMVSIDELVGACFVSLHSGLLGNVNMLLVFSPIIRGPRWFLTRKEVSSCNHAHISAFQTWLFFLEVWVKFFLEMYKMPSVVYIFYLVRPMNCHL